MQPAATPALLKVLPKGREREIFLPRGEAKKKR
jgi:hypothetical protein